MTAYDADFTRALIDYWKALPEVPLAVRRRAFESLRRSVATGETDPVALQVVALGDIDPDLVAVAAQAYVEARSTNAWAQPSAGLEVATDWIRRGLALNQKAVFRGVLRTGTEAAAQALKPLRSALQEA
jgi:hypothetical protein